VDDRTILVVQHEEGAPAGWLGDELERAGGRLDVRRPYAGDALPADLTGVDGAVVLGGGMAAWDDAVAPWLPGTRALIRAAEHSGVPVLGICLGHQLATRALGGEVGRNPAGTTVAVLPLCWGEDAADDPLFRAVLATTTGVHWNDDVVAALPPGARVVATSPDGAVQAARLGRSVWGVQFHPEAGADIVGRWVREDGQPYAEAGIDLEQYLYDIRTHESALREGCARLAASFLELVAQR